MKSFFSVLLRSFSGNVEESGRALARFSSILDHTLKIVTTIALLVAIELFRREQPSVYAHIASAAVGVFFYFYLQRLLEHVMLHVLDLADIDSTQERVRWTVGTITFLFAMVIMIRGGDLIGQLADLNFLNPDFNQEGG